MQRGRLAFFWPFRALLYRYPLTHMARTSPEYGIFHLPLQPTMGEESKNELKAQAHFLCPGPLPILPNFSLARP